MTLTISTAEAISLLLGLAALQIGSVKFFLDRYLAQIDKRFDQIDREIQGVGMDRSRLQEEMLRLQADLPLHYVRREDDIRNQATINAKLDALYRKIEEIKES